MNEVGVGARSINFLVDTILVFLISYGFYKWWSFYVMFWNYKFIPFWMFFFATLFVYYSFFELLLSRTPAKYITLTTVRNVQNKRPAFYQVLLRSLLRLTIIDLFFIPIIGRPLHDALSKTRVVEV